MVKGKLKEKEVIEHLHAEGFKKVRPQDKKAIWYKKASEKPACISKRKDSSLTGV